MGIFRGNEKKPFVEPSTDNYAKFYLSCEKKDRKSTTSDIAIFPYHLGWALIEKRGADNLAGIEEKKNTKENSKKD